MIIIIVLIVIIIVIIVIIIIIIIMRMKIIIIIVICNGNSNSEVTQNLSGFVYQFCYNFVNPSMPNSSLSLLSCWTHFPDT